MSQGSESHNREEKWEVDGAGKAERWAWNGSDHVSSITWLSMAQKFLLHRHSGLRPGELPGS